MTIYILYVSEVDNIQKMIAICELYLHMYLIVGVHDKYIGPFVAEGSGVGLRFEIARLKYCT